MKKIAIITDVHEEDINGVSTFIKNIKRRLIENGFEICMIHPGLFPNLLLPKYKDLRVSVFAKKKIEKILKEEKPDYIHIATEATLGLTTRLICIKNGWKFNTFYHTRIPEYISIRFGGLKKTTYRYMKWFHSAGENTLVGTSSLKEDLKKKGFKNVILCPLGVDTHFFQKNPDAKLPEGIKKPVFTFLGRVTPEKNLSEFLKCELAGTKLIIGDGSDRASLEKRFKKDTVFTGYKTGQELIDLLSISDVFVFPSKTETFGLVALEALSCGLPVAGYHNAEGIRDIITNGADGYLKRNLEEAIKKCLTLKHEDCRKKADKFSWERTVSTFIKELVNV